MKLHRTNILKIVKDYLNDYSEYNQLFSLDIEKGKNGGLIIKPENPRIKTTNDEKQMRLIKW